MHAKVMQMDKTIRSLLFEVDAPDLATVVAVAVAVRWLRSLLCTFQLGARRLRIHSWCCDGAGAVPDRGLQPLTIRRPSFDEGHAKQESGV